MSLPYKLRYSLARLKPFTQPVVWCPLLALALLAAFVLEQRNPPSSAWFDSLELGGSNSSSNEPETLPPSETLADIPDIDRLDALFNDLKTQPQALATLESANQNPSETTSNPSETTSTTLLSLLERARAQTQGLPSVNAPEVRPQYNNPFSAYLEKYRFLGSSLSSNTEQSSFLSPTAQPGSVNVSQLGLSPTNLSSLSTGEPSQQRSQLSLALEQRFLAESQPRTTQTRTASDDALEDVETNISITNPALNDQPSLIEGNLPDSSLSFIRTVPAMSPAPGTTGYTPPPALNLSPGALSTGGNAFTNLTTPQAASGSGGVPSLSQSGSAGGAAGVPSSVLPPTTGTQPQPQIQDVSPDPFSVPREPGRYVGGGYINTFSNPGAPPDY
ncbi:MAG: hypothetical protein QNJ46_10365 [Leptolyngbyaceae cyanobacterium MO_188.B28]|nr:hypothetical protein [Leptolyngbyaceae cyanobacterium MO_188.B28]